MNEVRPVVCETCYAFPGPSRGGGRAYGAAVGGGTASAAPRSAARTRVESTRRVVMGHEPSDSEQAM